jgi:CRP-like cAMP-binding protein
MDVPNEKNLLYFIKNWADISVQEEQLILNAFEPSSIKKKEHLLTPGKVCKSIYYIKKGCIRSYYIDDKGVEHIYQIRMDNSWISDLESFSSQKPSKLFIQALEDCAFLQISYDRLETLYKEVPAMERFFRILFQKAYVNTLKRLKANMWEPAINRYNAMLKEHPDMFQRIPQIYIASYLGITPESLSRLRKQA